MVSLSKLVKTVFMEKVTGYDGNGNIKKLERYGRTGASTYGKIDDLVYTYSGNKATSIKDTGAAAYSSDFRFSNGSNNTYSYSYDAAGRITADASKGISSITWNVLGLPQTVTFTDGASVTTEEVYYNDYYLLAYDTNFKWYDILSVPKEGENYLIYIHHPYLDEASFYAAIDSLHIDIGKMKRVRTLRRVLSRSVDVPQISQE